MSLSKSDISNIKSLHHKKIRKEKLEFVVEGEKCVNELLKSDYPIIQLYHTRDWKNTSATKATLIKPNELQRISTLSTPNKVLAVVKQKDTHFKNYEAEKINIYLHDIKDPGNLGTIIRIADWFGIKNIYLSHNSVEIYNPKCVQATMGSLFRVNCVYGQTEKILTAAKKSHAKIIAADVKGKNLYAYTKTQHTLLVMGSESHGLPMDVITLCDENISIPAYGNAESLNVAVAAGIICAEWLRV